MTGRGEKLDTRNIGRKLVFALLGLFAVSGFVAVAISVWLAQLDQSPKHSDWIATYARVVGVRTKRRSSDTNPHVLYYGQYAVEFSANRKQCLVWINTGVSDPDPSWVRGQIEGKRNGQIAIRYDPSDCKRAEVKTTEVNSP